MSYILSKKYARKDDSDFIVAAARAFYVDYWCSRMEELGKLPGPCELTEQAPETQRWAFKLARDFARRIVEESKEGSFTLEEYISAWASAAEASDHFLDEETIGWYAAMQAMGSGVGLHDYGIDVTLPYIEAYR